MALRHRSHELCLTLDQADQKLECVDEMSQVANIGVTDTGGAERTRPSTSQVSALLSGQSMAYILYNTGQPPDSIHLEGRSKSSVILSLPTEVLASVFSHFQHPGIQNGSLDVSKISMDFTSRRQSIQKLRLVCRVFNIIATQFLFPVLHIWPEEKFLSKIQALIESPHLQNGLFGIQIHSQYYFYELSAIKRSFYLFLRDKAWELTYQTTLSLNQDDSDPDPSWLAKREIMLDRLHAINSAAHRLLGGFPEDILAEYTSDNEELIEEFEEIIKKAYGGYQAKFLAHYKIMREKLITKKLASLVSTLTHKHSLSLSFITSSGKTLASGVLEGAEGVYECLTTPHPWEDFGTTMVNLAGREIALQAQILWDLPIAIYQAGGSLNSFEFTDALVTKEYSLVCPTQNLDLPLQAWPPNLSDLSKVCESLEIVRLDRLAYNFKLGHYNLPNISRNKQPPEDGFISIAEYLGVILSGKRLRSVALNTAIEKTSQFSGQRDRCPLGPVLAQLNFESITTISLSNIGISQRHLERFCQNIHNAIEMITLSDIALTDGSWENIVDLLREKVMQLYSNGKCSISIDELTGREIDSWTRRIKEPGEPGDPDELEIARLIDANKKVMKVLIGYIDGSGISSNPIPIQNVFL